MTAVVEVGTEAAPPVDGGTESKVEDVARAAIERADRGSTGERKGKRDKKEITPETREFWETWAEEKSTREPAPAAAADDAAAAPATEDDGERKPRGRDRDRGKGRSRDDKKTKVEGRRDEKRDDKGEKRTKRDTAVTPPPAMASADAQARLFVSLGKKHGVSAEDLRELLAAPIGGDKARIGSVSLRDSHAHVRVPEELVDQIIAGVNGTSHNEHDVTVERSRA
jgi:hypothetical protein